MKNLIYIMVLSSLFLAIFGWQLLNPATEHPLLLVGWLYFANLTIMGIVVIVGAVFWEIEPKISSLFINKDVK